MTWCSLNCCVHVIFRRLRICIHAILQLHFGSVQEVHNMYYLNNWRYSVASGSPPLIVWELGRQCTCHASTRSVTYILIGLKIYRYCRISSSSQLQVKPFWDLAKCTVLTTIVWFGYARISSNLLNTFIGLSSIFHKTPWNTCVSVCENLFDSIYLDARL